MFNRKGQILEINGDYALVMTDLCDFVKLKIRPEMSVGQEIAFEESDIRTASKSRYIKPFALVASVIFIVLSYVLYSQFFIPQAVYAYIDIDINPSIELAIDKKAHVLSVKPLNEDAKVLLDNLKPVGEPVTEAITQIVNESRLEGFIKSDVENAILVTASLNTGDGSKIKESDDKVLNNILTDISNIAFDVGTEKIKPEVLKVISEYRNSAIKSELSMGRYILYNKLKSEGVDITLEEVKSARVSDIIKKAHVEEIEGFISDEGNNKNKDSNVSRNYNKSTDTSANVSGNNGKSSEAVEGGKSDEKSNSGNLNDKGNDNSKRPEGQGASNAGGNQGSGVGEDKKDNNNGENVSEGKSDKSDKNSNSEPLKGGNSDNNKGALQGQKNGLEENTSSEAAKDKGNNSRSTEEDQSNKVKENPISEDVQDKGNGNKGSEEGKNDKANGNSNAGAAKSSKD